MAAAVVGLCKGLMHKGILRGVLQINQKYDH